MVLGKVALPSAHSPVLMLAETASGYVHGVHPMEVTTTLEEMRAEVPNELPAIASLLSALQTDFG